MKTNYEQFQHSAEIRIFFQCEDGPTCLYTYEGSWSLKGSPLGKVREYFLHVSSQLKIQILNDVI